jgi:hypothetical protein
LIAGSGKILVQRAGGGIQDSLAIRTAVEMLFDISRDRRGEFSL